MICESRLQLECFFVNYSFLPRSTFRLQKRMHINPPTRTAVPDGVNDFTITATLRLLPGDVGHAENR